MARIPISPGDRFGRWTVIQEGAGVRNPNGARARTIQCLCDCGITAEVRLVHLTGGRSQSCGCARFEMLAGLNTTHGHTVGRSQGRKETRAYQAWKAMKRRCYGVTTRGYRFYGARGIQVCERWKNSFENFLSDMGEPPEGLSLDRINSNGHYCPENCRWADVQTQAVNRRNSRLLTYQGETLCLSQWERRLGLPRKLLGRRLKEGWDAERILTTPPGTRRKPKKPSRGNYVTYQGETLCLKDWSRRLRIPQTTLHRWVKNGLTLEDVVIKYQEVKRS